MSTTIQIPGGTFNAELHEYRDENNVVVPSVTQIGDSLGFFDLDNVPGNTLEHKRQIGDAAHYACHLLDTNQDLDWSTVHSEVAPYVSAYIEAQEVLGMVVLESEVSGITAVNGMKFSFTYDKIAKISKFNFPFVVELKCAYQEEAYWKYQLAAYKAAKGDKTLGRLAIKLNKDGTFKPYLYENPRDIDRFIYMLAVVQTKLDEGIKWL